MVYATKNQATTTISKDTLAHKFRLMGIKDELELNVDTHASGWLQVGLRHADGSAIEGFGIDECVYVNGNELRYPVEWLGRGTTVSSLAGQPVRIVVKMRGARLYALQFTP